jgi:hypothetical protein
LEDAFMQRRLLPVWMANVLLSALTVVAADSIPESPSPPPSFAPTFNDLTQQATIFEPYPLSGAAYADPVPPVFAPSPPPTISDAAPPPTTDVLVPRGISSQGLVGRDFTTNNPRNGGGPYFSTEVVFLKPYASRGLFDAANPAQLKFEPSLRYVLGYQSAEGLGARVRYWSYDHGAGTNFGTGLGLRYRTIDAEMTQAVDFRRWQLLISGGLRYAQANIDYQNVFAPGNLGLGFNGFGLTAAAQASRDLNLRGTWRLATGARWSTVFGNSSAVGGGGPTTAYRDDLLSIIDLNLGPQFRLPLGNGAYLTGTAGAEAQFWSGTAAATFDTGFAGFGASLGITR